MKIVISGILEGIRTRADRTVALTFGSQELDSSVAGNLFQMRGQFGKLLFSDTNITPPEEALMDTTEIQDTRKIKTPSQRLRAVLFRVHEQGGATKETFDEWYKSEMEKIINHYKAKLTP